MTPIQSLAICHPSLMSSFVIDKVTRWLSIQSLAICHPSLMSSFVIGDQVAVYTELGYMSPISDVQFCYR